MADPKLGQPLTEREIQVLRLVAEGKKTQEITALLYLSADTVKSHLRRASVKLGAHGRPHLMAVAHEQGLLGATGVHPATAGGEYARGYRAGVASAQRWVRVLADRLEVAATTAIAKDGGGR